MDVRPLRDSRDFALLTTGTVATGTGNQMTLLALPYQVYVLTGSTFITGLLGLVVLPRQQALLAQVASGADAPPGDRSVVRLGMVTGVFNLLWATVVVLMIVRPGFTTGV